MAKQATRPIPIKSAKTPVATACQDGFASSALTAAAAAIASPRAAAQAVADEDIRLHAYLKWEAAGRPDGSDVFFWVEAERELRGA